MLLQPPNPVDVNPANVDLQVKATANVDLQVIATANLLMIVDMVTVQMTLLERLIVVIIILVVNVMPPNLNSTHSAKLITRLTHNKMIGYLKLRAKLN